jgi:hypothetical protein
MSKIEKAFSLFDAYNQTDPHTLHYEGKDYPTELFYALQLHKWVEKLEPGAPEKLLLASRAQHIGRWTSPRASYPDGKAGYYKWRTELAVFHATKAGELMKQAGYSEEEITEVQQIIQKKNLKSDAEVQTMEDALCLVFLEFQFEDFMHKHPEEKVIDIVKKTWAKMSEKGQKAALGKALE